MLAHFNFCCLSLYMISPVVKPYCSCLHHS
nr:MAG TPA: hypothetical protein [Microviridae sp.]